MAYGRYKSYAGFKSSYNAGRVKITVNHFRIHDVLKNVKNKPYIYFVYSLKFIIPLGMILVLNSKYPTRLVWIPLVVHLIMTYFFNGTMFTFSAGGITMLIGFIKKNGLAIELGAPFVAELIINNTVWSLIETQVAKEVIEDKEQFDRMWNDELILYVNEDILYSVNRSVHVSKKKNSSKGMVPTGRSDFIDDLAMKEEAYRARMKENEEAGKNETEK